MNMSINIAIVQNDAIGYPVKFLKSLTAGGNIHIHYINRMQFTANNHSKIIQWNYT